jgi:hypothetical protein
MPHLFHHGKKKKMKYKLLKLVILLIVLSAIFWAWENKDDFLGKEMSFGLKESSSAETETAIMMDRIAPSGDLAIMEPETTISYDYSGELFDVSGGVGSGIAEATYVDGMYYLRAEFEHIPPLKEGYFYEGWAVRKFPFHFISTGRIINQNRTYVNIYTSETDYTDHNFYVLTLEPEDGDPAPADHILEGTMSKR